MQLHKPACSYISLHGVTWSCMQVHKLAWSSLSLHAVPWAFRKFNELAAISRACMQFLLCLRSSQEFRSACQPSSCLHMSHDSGAISAWSRLFLPWLFPGLVPPDMAHNLDVRPSHRRWGSNPRVAQITELILYHLSNKTIGDVFKIDLKCTLRHTIRLLIECRCIFSRKSSPLMS